MQETAGIVVGGSCVDRDMSTDDVSPEPDDQQPDLQDPAAQPPLSSGEELQDPDGEVTDSLGVDTLAVENFRSPMRMN